jgi:hypothetical protein
MLSVCEGGTCTYLQQIPETAREANVRLLAVKRVRHILSNYIGTL